MIDLPQILWRNVNLSLLFATGIQGTYTYLKTNQPHNHLFQNVTHPEIVHGMNLSLNVYKYMSKQCTEHLVNYGFLQPW